MIPAGTTSTSEKVAVDATTTSRIVNVKKREGDCKNIINILLLIFLNIFYISKYKKKSVCEYYLANLCPHPWRHTEYPIILWVVLTAIQ